MSGAQLESNGQIRNIFPYLVMTGKKITLSIPVATFIGETKIGIDTSYIPYDRGPDKSGRVFIVINGVCAAISVDAGATTVISGALYYRQNDANKIYLGMLQQTVATPFGYNNPSGIYLAQQPLIAESVDNIGYFGFENLASAAGTATIITITVFANIGLYGDYAEPDWNSLFKVPRHEHIGMDYIEYLDSERDTQSLR